MGIEEAEKARLGRAEAGDQLVKPPLGNMENTRVVLIAEEWGSPSKPGVERSMTCGTGRGWRGMEV